MTIEQGLLLALGALAVFWMVGAHNRLVALRNGIAEAWAKVDEARRQRTEAGEALLALLAEPLAAEQGALDAMAAAVGASTRTAATLGHKPVDREAAVAWVAAEATLGATASRVFALAETGGALARDSVAAAPAAQWRDAEARLVFAKRLFNDAAAGYDAAIALFPTSLLVGMFRFSAAGRL